MSVGKKVYGLNDVPTGLPTPPLYRPEVVGYTYIRIYSGCYKEDGRVRSLRIRAFYGAFILIRIGPFLHASKFLHAL